MLCLVERQSRGKLGADPSMPLVRSRRSSQEKAPWKTLNSIEERVEADFVRPILLGESILPYRIFQPFEGVIPVNGDGSVLDSEAAANRGYTGILRWMRSAENVWNTHSETGMTLVEQFNYYGKLSSQFPIARTRIVYAASGTLPAACLVNDNRAVVEHKLYWGKSESETEARFLLAILNSEVTRSRAAHLQSVGQFGARDFDKVMFTLPIPRFDPREQLHESLAALAQKAEAVAANVVIGGSVKFQRARKLIREALTEAGIAQEIDRAVGELLGRP
jgi:hypothetical protein